uniref:Uncharacterized protein n=1 Tax=Caenorhabditis japonica TaxID=281687 RepID=A0A8R1I345_CAEJA
MTSSQNNSSHDHVYCSPEEEEDNYQAVERMFDSLYFFLPITALGALLANTIYLIVVTVGIKKGKLPLKRYALTINRTNADIFTILVGTYFFMKQKMERCDSHICLPAEYDLSKYVLQVVFILNYWCVSLSYTGIAVLTNYAVRAPLQYKHFPPAFCARLKDLKMDDSLAKAIAAKKPKFELSQAYCAWMEELKMEDSISGMIAKTITARKPKSERCPQDCFARMEELKKDGSMSGWMIEKATTA